MITTCKLSSLADTLDAARMERKAVVFDLGNPISGALWGDLELPPFCTLRSGSITLPANSKVWNFVVREVVIGLEC